MSGSFPANDRKHVGSAMHVPDMAAKIDLLLRHGPLRSRAALANTLGISISTFNGWIAGTAKSAEELVPNKRWFAFLDQFEKAMQRPVSRENLERLVVGNRHDLEQALKPDAAPILEDIIASDGRTGTSRLHIRPVIGLVELAQEPDPEVPVVKLNAPFMVEVAVQQRGHVLVLNNAGQLWGIVSFADGLPTSLAGPGSVVVPGIRDFRFVCLTEKTTTGLHRIVTFVSREPYPQIIFDVHRSAASLDWRALSELASHLNVLPRHHREVHVLRFQVV